jgi:hypothetical protein
VCVCFGFAPCTLLLSWLLFCRGVDGDYVMVLSCHSVVFRKKGVQLVNRQLWKCLVRSDSGYVILMAVVSISNI